MHRSQLSFGRVFLCFAGVLVLTSSPLRANDRTVLSQMLRSAADELDPSTLPTCVECAAEFHESADRANEFLRSPAFHESGAGWLEYLNLGTIRDAMDADADVDEQLRQVAALRQRLIGPIPGVEFEPLVQLRDRASCLEVALLCSDGKSFLRQLQTQLIDLANQLQSDAENVQGALSASEIRSIGEVVSMLSASKQSPTIVDRIRRMFAHPNAVVTLSESFVQRAIGGSFSEARPINDCILGTHVVGQAQVHADVTVDLQPSVAVSQMTINVHSQMTSRSRGYNGPVAMNMVGGGDAVASRTLRIDDQGVLLKPVQVEANLTNEIRSIEHPLRLVRRIAARRAQDQKAQADQIAKAKVEAQMGQQLAAKTDSAGSLRPDDVLCASASLVASVRRG